MTDTHLQTASAQPFVAVVTGASRVRRVLGGGAAQVMTTTTGADMAESERS
jgi:hypothetical protein